MSDRAAPSPRWGLLWVVFAVLLPLVGLAGRFAWAGPRAAPPPRATPCGQLRLGMTKRDVAAAVGRKAGSRPAARQGRVYAKVCREGVPLSPDVAPSSCERWDWGGYVLWAIFDEDDRLIGYSLLEALDDADLPDDGR